MCGEFRSAAPVKHVEDCSVCCGGFVCGCRRANFPLLHAQTEKEGGHMGLDLLSMQCLWHDIVNRKLPWLWRSTLHVLRRTQAHAITRSTSAPDTCGRWGDNRASASPWCPLETFSAMGGRAVGLKEAHESIELLEFALSLGASSPRAQDAFSMPDDDSFYPRLSRLTIRITTIPVHAAECKRIAHSRFHRHTIDGRGSGSHSRNADASTSRYEPLSKETHVCGGFNPTIDHTQVQGKIAARLGVVRARAPPAVVIRPEGCSKNIDPLAQHMGSF